MMRARASMFVASSVALHLVLGGGAVWLAKRGHADHGDDTKPTFTGETFEIATQSEEHPREVLPTIEEPTPEDLHGEAPVITHPQSHIGVHGAATGTRASEPPPLTFGALGDRSAADVVVSLARGFPQAASTDPMWHTVSFGDAGSAIMEIELEPDGSLARWNLGQGASPALRSAMVRTMAFIGGRSFLARGAVTRLRVSARVTEDAVRDGTDAVYAIHSEHEGDRASAYFSLASGRRVDLVIDPVK